MYARTLHSLITLLLLIKVSAELKESEVGIYKKPTTDLIYPYSVYEEELSKELKDLTSRASFPEWIKYKDEFIEFSYPKHPAITLETSGSYKLLAYDTEIFNIYLAKLPIPYDDFNNGAGIYMKRLIKNSKLYSFYYLKSGALKYMETRSAKVYAQTSYWTDVTLHHAVFKKIARSIELKDKSSVSKKEFQKDLSKTMLVSWFDFTTTKEQAIAALGQPFEKHQDHIIWKVKNEYYGYRWTDTITLPFKNGKIAPIDYGFFKSGSDKRVAIKGTVSWLYEELKPHFQQEKQTLKKEQAEKFLNMTYNFASQKKRTEHSAYLLYLDIIPTLIEQGYKTDKLIELCREEFRLHKLNYAGRVLLKNADSKDLDYFVSEAKNLIKEINLGQKTINESDANLSMFLRFCKEHPKFDDVLREGLSSPNEEIQLNSYYMLNESNFSKDEFNQWFQKGLKDKSSVVRSISLNSFKDKRVNKQSLNLLKELSETEKDEFVLQKVNEALKNQDFIESQKK